MSNELSGNILEKVKTKIAISNFCKKEKFNMPKSKVLRIAASFILILGITYGVVYAGYKLTKYFSIKGIDDTGIQTALENEYVQNIDMDYIEKEKVKFKVDYLMMDDINFDLVFNFITQDSVNNYEGIAVKNLQITDENNNQIYISSEDQNIWTNNIALSSELWTNVEKHDNILRQVLHLSSNNFPKSKKIYVSFESVILYNVNKGNPIIIEYEDTYKLEFDVSDQLVNRKSIKYVVKDKNVEDAKLTNSGFAVTINREWFKSENEKFSLKDSNGNTYTVSNILSVYNIENLEMPEKVVLIFNITKYNESNSITIIQEGGGTINLIKEY